MGSVDRVEAGVDSARSETSALMARWGIPGRVGLRIDGPGRRHSWGVDGAEVKGTSALPPKHCRAARSQPRPAPDAGRGVGERCNKGRGLDTGKLRLAVGDCPQCKLANIVVADDLPQQLVRSDAVQLLEREQGRDAPMQWP